MATHLFTTRHWRLGSRAAGVHAQAWDDVAAALAVEPRRLVRVRQVHGAEVAIAKNGAVSQPDADIVITSDPGLALAVGVADCVPLLLADRRTGAVAAAHAGWKGLAARVPMVTIEALVRECGSRREDLLAVAGPSVGACCYEVGLEVRAGFTRAGFSEGDLERWFLRAPAPTAENPSMPGLRPPRPDHWYFDGWAAARDQLIAAGMSAPQIFVAGLCTASHAEALCSYRRDGAPAGRLAAAIRCARRRP
jgi:YfiH family protein